MIKLKPILETQLIKEALPLGMAKRFTSITQNPDMKARQDNILEFLKQQPDVKVSRRGDRVAVPFTSYVPPVRDKAASDALISFYKNIIKRVEAANKILRPKGQFFKIGTSIDSWAMPTMQDQYGRDVKMSKYISAVVNMENLPIGRRIEANFEKDPETGKEVLIKRSGEKIPADKVRQIHRSEIKREIDELIKQYSEIPEVQELRNSKPKTYYIVFSKHAYDIAGMSTDRGWTSCMNLYTGSNQRYVCFDVVEGTMVAYLVREDDLNIKNPTARIAIKPYVNIDNPDDVLYEPEGKVYGTAPADFAKQVNELITAAQPSKKGTFSLVDTLYCDSKSSVTRFGDPKMVERAEELIATGKQATTVDEALYMIQTYCVQEGNDRSPHLFKFYDADGLYVNSQQIITISDKLAYSPVKFNFALQFVIKRVGQDALKTFPEEVKQMFLRLPNIRNFEGMPTKINSQLHIDGFRGDNFKGLQPGPRLLSIGTARIDGTTESVIKSFEGIPATVDELYLDPLTIMDMTIQEFIEHLKPVQLRSIRYRWNIPTPNGTGKSKLAQSMIDWMKTIPPAISKEHGEIPNSQYKRMMRQVTKQLPTIQWLFGTPVDQLFYWNGTPEPEWIDTSDRNID